jgi:GHH signature containing HNH/Endo VII superfamily nuclease toxin  2
MATTPNTPATYYLDTEAAKTDCAKDKADMEKKCAPDDKNKNRGKGRPKARDSEKNADKDASWVLDHCGPLMVQPGLENFTKWQEEFADIQSSLTQLADLLKNDVITKLEQEALEYAGKKIAELAVRRGLTGWIPVVGWVLTAVDVAVTATDAIQRAQDISDMVKDLKETVDRLKKAADEISGTLKDYKKDLEGFGNLSEDRKKEVASKVMADIQAAYAAANPCLRARKCMLVPFNKGYGAKWAGKGCCPGQTGHHILPDAMFRDAAGTVKAKEVYKQKNKDSMKGWKRYMAPTRPCWDKYTEGSSPTMCVEGNNQHLGSHGAIHGRTKYKLGKSGYAGQDDMPYSVARDLVLEEIAESYGCKKECLKEQLDAYYCGKAASKKPGCPDCENAKVRPHDGTGEQSVPQEDDIQIN